MNYGKGIKAKEERRVHNVTGVKNRGRRRRDISLLDEVIFGVSGNAAEAREGVTNRNLKEIRRHCFLRRKDERSRRQLEFLSRWGGHGDGSKK